MLIPSIDLSRGRTVQWIAGRDPALDLGDPRPFAERFGRVGEVAVVDLDAALGQGDNVSSIDDLLRLAPCRVGGGIRDADTALDWLERGAARVVLGTAARPDLLRQLPPERVVVALDARDGEVVVEGWRTGTGRGVAERMRELRGLCSGFLVTFVEREGRLGGTALDRVPELVAAAGDARVTIAGGVTTTDEIAALDRLGCDAQVGMALYSGRLGLAEAFAAPLRSDRPDGLLATVVCDERGMALGLAWSDRESLARALETGRGVYRSRGRGLWEKGASSGATQELVRIDVDCDRDALRFVVRQAGSGFCHRRTRSCFGPARGLDRLEQVIAERRASAAPDSYTGRLLADSRLLGDKLAEEAAELAAARTREEVVWETADLLYFALVAAGRAGVGLAEVEAELDRRADLRRRPVEPSQPASSDPLPRRDWRSVQGASVEPVDAGTRRAAERIVEDVIDGGEPALRRWAERLDDLAPGAELRLGPDRLRAAFESLPAERQGVLLRTAGRIRRFAQAQRDALGDLDVAVDGGRAGIDLAPVDVAGCYAPGGRFPLPSSVLMTAVTARVAGVGRVVVASPRPTVETLAAAHVAGADALIPVGGAQAIAALAYGAGAVPRCDAIVGPGNRWVTAAKQLVAGRVVIDMLAGPSELLVVADSDADPELVAADLLAQAEHDPDAVPILVSTDAELPDAVDRALAAQLADLPTAEVARQALAGGFATVVPDLDAAARVADTLAPEHLALHVDDPERLAARLRHHGALFVGAGAAEVLGDYGAGPNHVLPTGGTARSRGALSVLTFLRTRTWLRIDDAGAAGELTRDAVTLARMEGLEAHARAAERRLLQP